MRRRIGRYLFVADHLCYVIAKFHHTDTDTDFFAAKLRWVRAGPFRRKKVRVRVRVGPVSV